MTDTTAARRIREWLTSQPMTFTTELDLQTAIAARLQHEVGIGHPITKYSIERRLDDRNRIDFLVSIRERLDAPGYANVGIEVKIGGSYAAVRRQLDRYARFPEIDQLLLVTTKASHHQIPYTLHGKPVVLCSLVEAGL